MNKKVWYWVLGGLAALLILALLWRSLSGRPGAPAASPAPTATGSGQMDHSQMDHGPSQPPEDPDLRGYLEDQDTIMKDMMAGMEGIDRSGNAAIDFLAGMIPHHRSAVAMAESYQNYGGSHQVLAPLAQDIITTQTEEIEQMEGMIEDLKAGGQTDEAQAKAYLDAYDALMDHSMSHASAGSLDAAFAEGMIAHHQMAVDMANAILPHTEDQGVKDLAQAIVDAQEREIGSMQDVLDQLKAQ